MDYGSRRSGRQRAAPDRYGVPVTNDDYLDQQSYAPITMSRSSSSSSTQTHPTRVNIMPHSVPPHQSTMMHRTQMNINQYVNVPAPNIQRPNNSLRSMPVYNNNFNPYGHRNYQPHNTRKSIDFPMVSMNSYEIVDVLCPLSPYSKGLHHFLLSPIIPSIF